MRTIAAVAAGCLLATAFVSQALSADPAKPANYPNRPINFVVAYPVGGGMDITARTLASEMERVTGHQFRVENRGGGGGIIGNTHMAKQTQPDGYTVGILANPTLFMNILNQGASFKKEDFEPIAGIVFEPVIWTTKSDSEFGKMTFKQIIDYAKAKPREGEGRGSFPNASFDIATRHRRQETGAQVHHRALQGGKPAIRRASRRQHRHFGQSTSADRPVRTGRQCQGAGVADNEPLVEDPRCR